MFSIIPPSSARLPSCTTFPALSKPLNLDGNTVVDIFLGKVRKWNDGKIAKLNPGVALPGS